MLETYRRQNCERGPHTGSPSGLGDRSKHERNQKHVRPTQCPLVPAAVLRSFKLRVPTVQVPSRTGHPPAVFDTDLSRPAQIRSLKLQERKA